MRQVAHCCRGLSHEGKYIFANVHFKMTQATSLVGIGKKRESCHDLSYSSSIISSLLTCCHNVPFVESCLLWSSERMRQDWRVMFPLLGWIMLTFSNLDHVYLPRNNLVESCLPSSRQNRNFSVCQWVPSSDPPPCFEFFRNTTIKWAPSSDSSSLLCICSAALCPHSWWRCTCTIEA